MVKTYYPHWGEYTAFNSFIKYFDQQKFKLKMWNVPIGNKRLPIPFVKKYLHCRITENKVTEYKLNDLHAEILLAMNVILKKIDIIHLLDAEHALMFLPYLLKKISVLKKVPKIIAMFHQPPEILDKIINIDIVKQIDMVLVVSHTQAEYFSRFLPTDRIHTILLGIDTEHFKPSEQNNNLSGCSLHPGLKTPGVSGRKKFRCLGGGVWLRDYEAIFRTAKILRNEKDIEFYLVAPEKPEYKPLDNVFFLENISDQELLEYYRNSDILFLPMLDATANTFLLEGCACGLPLVSSNLESIRTYFPGPEAVLVKNNNPSIFAETIRKLKSDKHKLTEMSCYARKRALELSWEKITKDYESQYNRILSV